MDTLLLEKNRITDEKMAHDFALDGIAKGQQIKQTVRGLNERLKIAKELKASGQVKLFTREIDRVERAYKIAHQNPYPECTRAEAMDAMCEPIKPPEPSPVEKVKGSMTDNMRRTLERAMGTAERMIVMDDSQSLKKTLNEMASFQNAMLNEQAYRSVMQARPGSIMHYGLSAQISAPWDQGFLRGGYSRATHKYDLETARLTLGSALREGQEETQTMLPMSALCRLKEAAEKKMFDMFEVWRPAEWKAPDPWLVGVWHDDNGTSHYFKVCDWR